MLINDSAKRFLAILGKIPMFQRLLPVQALEILKICKTQSFSDHEALTSYGSRSTEMYILLSGQLVVTASDGTELAVLSPITSVGEMGLITGQPRTANVVARGKASALVIHKIKFEVLLKRFPDVGFVIFRNIIQTLSSRLDVTNHQLVEAQRELDSVKNSSALSSP